VIGVDVDAVACAITRFEIRAAKTPELWPKLSHLMEEIGKDLAPYYRTETSEIEDREVLHYFWVQQVVCGNCGVPVEAHPHHQLAYEAEGDRQWAFCPSCHGVQELSRNDTEVRRRRCRGRRARVCRLVGRCRADASPTSGFHSRRSDPCEQVFPGHARSSRRCRASPTQSTGPVRPAPRAVGARGLASGPVVRLYRRAFSRAFVWGLWRSHGHSGLFKKERHGVGSVGDRVQGFRKRVGKDRA
jgi:hypothetical protein